MPVRGKHVKRRVRFPRYWKYVEDARRAYVAILLAGTGGDVDRAAKISGVTAATVRRFGLRRGRRS